MNEEKFQKADALRRAISNTENDLDLAKKRVRVLYVNDRGGSDYLEISKETISIIQTIVVAHLEKKLSDLNREYAEL